MDVKQTVRDKIKKAGIKKIKRNYKNVSYAFSKTKCNFIKKELEKGNQVLALKLEGLKGVFTKKEEPFKSFAEGLCDDAKKIDQYGFISTDELPAYGISKTEIESVKNMTDSSEKDVVVLVAADEETARSALDLIASRLELIIHT